MNDQEQERTGDPCPACGKVGKYEFDHYECENPGCSVLYYLGNEPYRGTVTE